MHPTPRSLTVLEDGGLHRISPSIPRTPSALNDPVILQAVREALLERLDPALLDPVSPASQRDPEVLRVLRGLIGAQIEQGYGPLRGLPQDEAALLQLFQEALGWGPAQPYLDDERIQEVKIIGDLIMVQEEGSDFTLVPERFASPRQALDRALILAARLNVPLSRARPQDTLPLAHGTRVHVSIPPCTPEESALICIRRGRRNPWGLDEILNRGACDANVGGLLRLLARAGCSFIIAGETGSGKTALLEALINTWPGEPHVITIEDNTQEIAVRHRAWTRELVQTALEPGAFGRAAREVLRQTPSLVAPGETRAEEAGAILAVAVSGHAVMTTIHARSAQRAVMRFADCAAMPGAYIYAGRREHALEDACDNFHALVHVEKSGGQRYINEILLLNGVEERDGRLRPRTLRLAWAEVGENGIFWQSAASADGDRLLWAGGQQTPAPLARRLQMLQNRDRVRVIASSRALIADALKRAEIAIRAGGSEQALAILRRAWAERRDERLAAAAQRALEIDLATAARYTTIAREIAERARAAMHARDWQAARSAYDEASNNLALYAAYTPAGGWPSLLAQLERAEAHEAAAISAVQRATHAVVQGHSRDAVALLSQFEASNLSATSAISLLSARRAALAQLCAAGEISADALIPVDAALQSYAEAAHA
ncbi:type II secretion system protein E [Oscillochloris trichoides DG-6]|uniref:Type II secretion system protein E n=1 Tax=Oscillochloris trichoides DG-6 TaxID=765420 RepID=E1IBI6_9CHLR|nr:ATPase, T2SS/T4P/T4SS family [Oscillochloris trichoides]EFO81405.1 type II secretion system protein E [Oscillochloris trichoides DG-6]